MRIFNMRVVVLLGLLGLAWNCFATQQGRSTDQTVEDEDIVVTSAAEMRYPAVARAANIQSVVVVRIRLDDRGHGGRGNRCFRFKSIASERLDGGYYSLYV